MNSEVIASMLRDAGAIVVQAVDGDQAVAALGREPFDLAFIDLHMPGCDGLTVARFARGSATETSGVAASRNPTTPLVALTAAVLRTDRERCVEAGMCDFVAKPFTRASLGAALDRWCRPRVSGAIDRAVIAELAEWTGDAALDRAVARFGTTTEQAVAAIASAVADGAASRVGDLAHATQSSAGQLGARDLAEQLRADRGGRTRGRLPRR
ncbi:MAG: response regulator [Deltaproteobacteria bacterium]|nr:response regulator [Deltaproteobacteria bacterium]